jgi:hypothetical protein
LTGINQKSTLPWGTVQPKPNYRLAVNITGPSTVTNDGSGSTYAYQLPVRNTGKLKIVHVKLWFAPAQFIAGSSVHWSDAGTCTLSNVRAGTKRTITVWLDPQRSTATSWKLKLLAKGLGVATNAKASKIKTVNVTTASTSTG